MIPCPKLSSTTVMQAFSSLCIVFESAVYIHSNRGVTSCLNAYDISSRSGSGQKKSQPHVTCGVTASVKNRRVSERLISWQLPIKGSRWNIEKKKPDM